MYRIVAIFYITYKVNSPAKSSMQLAPYLFITPLLTIFSDCKVFLNDTFNIFLFPLFPFLQKY